MPPGIPRRASDTCGRWKKGSARTAGAGLKATAARSDCKEERCRELVRQAPQMTDRLCPGCEAHFRQLREILDRLQVPYLLNPRLVRGLDYYSRTAFEFSP